MLVMNNIFFTADTHTQYDNSGDTNAKLLALRLIIMSAAQVLFYLRSRTLFFLSLVADF